MNTDETARILLRLNEAYHREPGPGELAVWAEQIGRFDYDVALESTQLIVRTQDRFPTVNRFYETALAVLRQRTLLDQSGLALTLPWPKEEDFRAGLSRAREALAGAVWRAENWNTDRRVVPAPSPEPGEGQPVGTPLGRDGGGAGAYAGSVT